MAQVVAACFRPDCNMEAKKALKEQGFAMRRASAWQ
jgi:hypothetical protein